MSNPCPTCTAASAWGCPVHAPKHMEASKPDADLFAQQRRDAALWREVRPLLKEWMDEDNGILSSGELALSAFCCRRKSDLEAL